VATVAQQPGTSPMLSNDLVSVPTPVLTSCLKSTISASRLSGNCHTGIGECQILGQSNPALRLPITRGNWSKILLPNWLSKCHAATLVNLGESPSSIARFCLVFWASSLFIECDLKRIQNKAALKVLSKSVKAMSSNPVCNSLLFATAPSGPRRWRRRRARYAHPTV
jgi:hypothetical protein